MQQAAEPGRHRLRNIHQAGAASRLPLAVSRQDLVPFAQHPVGERWITHRDPLPSERDS